jgi:hypothetical protein
LLCWLVPTPSSIKELILLSADHHAAVWGFADGRGGGGGDVP